MATRFMNNQTLFTIALVVVGFLQMAGIWARRKIAKQQLQLDKEKFAYRKFLDRYNKVPVDEFEREYDSG
jgi:hypothetical protein